MENKQAFMNKGVYSMRGIIFLICNRGKPVQTAKMEAGSTGRWSIYKVLFQMNYCNLH